MLYFIIYIILGAIIGVLTWFWYSSKHHNRIYEGSILLYLFGCVLFWPAILINTVIDIIKVIIKEYCS